MDLSTADDIQKQLQEQLQVLKNNAANTLSKLQQGSGGEGGRSGVPVISSASLTWASKYQPSCAADICGNAESVEHLKSWLLTWQEKMKRERLQPMSGEEKMKRESMTCSGR